MKVLLLSAYDAQSHQYWRKLLVSVFEDFEWTVLTLPPRNFSWRIRSNSLTWAFKFREVLEQPYDLIVATSMVDLSALRGFVPALASSPTLLYFHENQFAYPTSERQFESVEPKILNLYSALSADHIAFNSEYNRNTFLDGVDKVLGKMPDHVPPDITLGLLEKSSILPVPLSDDAYMSRIKIDKPTIALVWNHRWEYDKAPERFFDAIKRVLHAGIELDLSVVGQCFRNHPQVFEEMKRYLDLNFPGVIKNWGYIESATDYRDLLAQTDIVISTAVHDFQGLAIMEAVAAGCLPVLPDRLCYSEWFGNEWLYESQLNNPSVESSGLADRIIELSHQKRLGTLPEPPDIEHFSISNMKITYQQIFEKTLRDYGHRSL